MRIQISDQAVQEQEVAFTKTHQRLQGVILNYLYYTTGQIANFDDIAQEIFVKLWLDWPRLMTFSEKGLDEYVRKMVSNRVKNQAKKQNRVNRFTRYYSQMNSEGCQEDSMLFNEGFRLYEKAVNLLTPKERMVFLLDENDFSRREIAEMTNRSANTIDNQLSSAYKFVKSYMNKNFELNLREGGRRKYVKSSSLN
jgi:RNA polymerase sigma-70 factor (ECF subfamily)